MDKFDAAAYLALAEKHRATHTMLVPVQYQRIMALADFNRFDLSSFRFKFCTSAPFSAGLKADILKRWLGGLVEFYGLTEGGGTCLLAAAALLLVLWLHLLPGGVAAPIYDAYAKQDLADQDLV